MASNAARVSSSILSKFSERFRVNGVGPESLLGGREPATLEVAGSSPSVLALHGFGGTSYEVEPVVEVARELGLCALAPLLPGHGTSVLDLSRKRFPDFSEAAARAFEELHGNVVLVGFSMGSLLAIDLAVRNPERVIGLVLLGNAISLSSPFPDLALALIERFKLPDFFAKKVNGPDIGDSESRATHVTYSAHPVHAAIDVRRAGILARARLGLVRCPTLVLHGAKDRVCPVENAWRVAECLGTDDCRVVIYPHSRHILTRDVERDAVKREISGFFERLRALEQARAQTPVEP